MSDGGILESTRSTAGCRISTGVHWVARTAASAAAATAAADVESDASERADAAEVYLLSPCMAPCKGVAKGKVSKVASGPSAVTAADKGALADS